jgi:hypothetical protein
MRFTLLLPFVLLGLAHAVSQSDFTRRDTDTAGPSPFKPPPKCSGFGSCTNPGVCQVPPETSDSGVVCTCQNENCPLANPDDVCECPPCTYSLLLLAIMLALTNA